MAKVLRCNDLGTGCPPVLKADTEDELMAQAEEHAKEHGLPGIPAEFKEYVRRAIKDE